METSEILASEPERFLAQKSILHVKAFLDGFACVDVLGKDIDLLTPLINDFSQFLSQKYDDPWPELFKQGYNDSEAFELYFKEWRVFCSEKQRSSSINLIAKRRVQMIDISSTLGHIKSRSGMYFIQPSIGFLFSYLQGVQRCCECYTVGAHLVPDIQQFEAWLCRKFDLKKTCRWDRLLLVENGFNEQMAFQNFFESLDVYAGGGS